MARTETLLVKQMGLQPYAETWRAMRDYTEGRDGTSMDQLWLLEHPPVFTLGQAGKPEHLLHPGDIPVIKSDRGGQVTYHGPGQLMVYLLLDLRRARLGVRGLVTLLEQSVIDLLAAKGIQATARRDAPGVYVGEAKLAAVGLRVRHGCCFHGLSLNVAMDLSPFERINPCGYPGLPVCQLSEFLPDTDLQQVQEELSQHLAQGLGYTLEYEPQRMDDAKDHLPPSRATPESHQRGKSKLSRIPVKVAEQVSLPRKPPWIRTKAPMGKEVMRIRRTLREKGLSSVCEEAACPNLGECFHQGTATFMIMGDICTRRCPFCDVAHGKPQPLDPHEPAQLAEAIAHMGLKYVVITSVDRDDLRDGGAGHFAACVAAVRQQMPQTKVEVLVPDFRGRVPVALEALGHHPPDLFNHNLETVPRLYRQARPGADYLGSLKLLQAFKAAQPALPTKSGLMLGLGETHQEILQVLRDLRDHDCAMLTLGQYLQPSRDHLPVQRFVTPEEFEELRREAEAMGFTNVASGPMVRSSYHADLQANPFFGK